MDILFNFAENLHDLLVENNLKAKNLADILGIGNGTIARYLNRTRIPSLEYIVKIADYFNCTIDYLIGLEDENSTTTFFPYPPFAERLMYLLDYFHLPASSIYQNESISKARFYVWKNGKGLPNLDNLISLAKIFNCSVDFVIGRAKA